MKLEFQESPEGYYDVWNRKDDLLGTIEWNKRWNKWCWEQQIDIIMSWDCLEKVVEFMKKCKPKIIQSKLKITISTGVKE